MRDNMKIYFFFLMIYCLLISCSSEKASKKKNPEFFLSFYNGIPKNDSLKIEIDYDKSKDSLGVCATNISDKEMVLPYFRETNLSYRGGPGFVLFVYEEQDNDYVEVTEDPDYDALYLNSIRDRKLASREKNCEPVFSPDFFYKFLSGKTYKFVVRYYAEYTYQHHDKFVQSNIVTVKW
jgi:hypothetical protein